METKAVALLGFLSGRGYPTMICKDTSTELELMRQLKEFENTKSSSEVETLLKGDWRLLCTTNDHLYLLSAIIGGPLKEYFEHIEKDRIHTATPFKGLTMLILSPFLISLSLSICGSLFLSFSSSFFVTITFFFVVAKYAPSGIFISRRDHVSVTSDFILTSRLEREVVGLLGSTFKFNKKEKNPMKEFVTRFDMSNGAKDALENSWMFGWRLIPNWYCLHLLTRQTTRQEKIVYIDNNVRFMLGGDSLPDGNTTCYVSIFVRV